jgi:hypothetical protein
MIAQPDDSDAPDFLAIVRRGGRALREITPRLQLSLQGRGQPLVLFLPCEGRQGAALFRCYLLGAQLRGLGWRCIVLSPRLTLAQRIRFLKAAAPDLIVMQGARHALNRPDYYTGVPIVYDLDDADFHLPHLATATEQAMPQVVAVLAGSQYIADWCDAARARNVHVVWTGAPVSSVSHVPHSRRGAVVAWAQTRPMTYTREAEWVRCVVRRLGQRHPGLTLRLFDRRPTDDPSFADSFAGAGVAVDWRASQSYGRYLQSLNDVAVGLAPLAHETPFSRGKSFGKILAYLDRRVPVIASDVGEPARFFTPATGIVSNERAVWCDGASRLLLDAGARTRMTERAFGQFRHRLSIDAAARRVDVVLRDVLQGAKPV